MYTVQINVEDTLKTFDNFKNKQSIRSFMFFDI